MCFERGADLFGKPIEHIGQRLEHVQSCFSRNAFVETFEGFGKHRPISRHPFVDARSDHLVYVAACDGNAVAESMEHPLCGGYLSRQAFELGGTRNERTKVETKGLFDLTPLPSPRVAFSVWAVATKDQAKINQTG